MTPRLRVGRRPRTTRATRSRLRDSLGDEAYARAAHTGRRLTPAQALARLADTGSV